MGRKVNTITLTEEQRSYLELQTRARTIQAQTVCRARILLLRADGVSINDIADKVGINRCSVMLCLNKFNEYSCAAEPPVQCGVSHLSRRTEPHRL